MAVYGKLIKSDGKPMALRLPATINIDIRITAPDGTKERDLPSGVMDVLHEALTMIIAKMIDVPKEFDRGKDLLDSSLFIQNYTIVSENEAKEIFEAELAEKLSKCKSKKDFQDVCSKYGVEIKYVSPGKDSIN